MGEKSLLDIILDPDNTDPVTLYGEDGEERLLFVILNPLDELDWAEDDEAIVFRVVESEDGSVSLHMEENEDLAMQVFQEYYRLLDEEGGE